MIIQAASIMTSHDQLSAIKTICGTIAAVLIPLGITFIWAWAFVNRNRR